MRRRFDGLLELLFPPQCCHCQTWLPGESWTAGAFCVPCSAALPWLDAHSCNQCQQRPPASERGRCDACEREESALEDCTAAVWYTEEVNGWISRFKYPDWGVGGLDPAPLAVARTLACCAASGAPGDLPDVIVPVPLHPKRLARRGFNPAALAAREIARALALPLAPASLRRTRDTPSQTNLGRADRRINVQDAFRAASPAARRVWLVDDVVTTGATLEACATALRAAGAQHVSAVVLARTPEPARPESLSAASDSRPLRRSRPATGRGPRAS